MNKLIALILVALTIPANASYIDTIVSDPFHPKMSLSLMYTSKMESDGGVTDVALAFHKADPKDSLWPQKLIDAGVPALTWTLLECGVGGNRDSAFAECGASIDAAQTMLGPIASALKNAGGYYAVFGNMLVSSDGGGVKIGMGWKSNIIQRGGFEQLDHLRFPPRYKLGYMYQF